MFHDVPASKNGAKFNIDHVAVGPQGVFAIETKARRKKERGSGADAATVLFDGRNLTWPKPRGIDNAALEQAERNAEWLIDALRVVLREHVHVDPIVTIPGWCVKIADSPHSRRAKVAITKVISNFLSSGIVRLDKEGIKTIADVLAVRCRTVEY